MTDASNKDLVIAAVLAGPGKTLRQIADECGVSVGTACLYRKLAFALPGRRVAPALPIAIRKPDPRANYRIPIEARRDPNAPRVRLHLRPEDIFGTKPNGSEWPNRDDAGGAA